MLKIGAQIGAFVDVPIDRQALNHGGVAGAAGLGHLGPAGDPFVHRIGEPIGRAGDQSVAAELKLDLVIDAPAVLGLVVKAEGQFGGSVTAERGAQLGLDHGAGAGRWGPMRAEDQGGVGLAAAGGAVPAVLKADLAAQGLAQMPGIDRVHGQPRAVVDPVAGVFRAEGDVAAPVDLFAIAQADLGGAGAGQPALSVEVAARVDRLESEVAGFGLQLIGQACSVVLVAHGVLRPGHLGLPQPALAVFVLEVGRVHPLAGRVAQGGVGMDRTGAHRGPLGQGIVHLTAIEPIGFGALGLNLIGHADRHGVAVKVELAHRAVEGDGVAEEVEQIVSAAQQGRGRQDIAAVFVPHEDLHPFGPLHIAAQVKVIGARDAAPADFLNLLLLRCPGGEDGDRNAVVLPMALGAGGDTLQAAQFQRAGLRRDGDIAVEHIGAAFLYLYEEVGRRLRIGPAFGIVAVDGVVFLAPDVAEQAVFGVPVRAVAQGQQGIATDHPFEVELTPDPGGGVLEGADAVLFDNIARISTQRNRTFDHTDQHTFVQVGGEGHPRLGLAKGGAHGDQIGAGGLRRDQVEGRFAIVEIGLHAGRAAADVGHIPKRPASGEGHGARGGHRAAPGVKYAHHDRHHRGGIGRSGFRHQDLDPGRFAGGGQAQLFADTFDAETVTAHQCQHILARGQFHGHIFQRLHIVLCQIGAFAHPVAAQLAPVHQKRQREIGLALDPDVLCGAGDGGVFGKVDKARRAIEVLDHAVERLTLGRGTGRLRDRGGFTPGLFALCRDHAGGQLGGGGDASLTAHGAGAAALAVDR